MTYRIAQDTDYDRILEIRAEARARIAEAKLPIWKHDYPLLDMLREDIQNGWGRVVEEDGEVLGYAALHISEEEYPAGTFKRGNLLSFGRVMVADKAQGKHVATFLVSEMIEETRRRGFAGLGIGVDACNERALRLYTRRGFVREGFFKFTFADLDTYVIYF